MNKRALNIKENKEMVRALLLFNIKYFNNILIIIVNTCCLQLAKLMAELKKVPGIFPDGRLGISASTTVI